MADKKKKVEDTIAKVKSAESPDEVVADPNASPAPAGYDAQGQLLKK